MTGPRELVRRVGRARRVGVAFGRIYLGIKGHQLLDRHLRPADMDLRWHRLHREHARLLRRSALELRGLVLKGCQFLSARADVLPPEYVETLSTLQDRVPPTPAERAVRLVEAELGRPLGEVFTRFHRRPLASASLAQVHRAVLRDGREVAVKVQHPGIEELVRADLASLRVLFGAVERIEGSLALTPLFDEIAEAIPTELDFRAEARHAERLRELFAGRADVVIPEIVHELSTRRVLVLEYLPGIKITDLPALEAAGVDPARVARLLAEVFAEQILRFGFFHADPHPGNLLVLPDGPRLALVDFGLAKELPPGFRDDLAAFVFALLRGDSGAMAAALVRLGFETRDGGPDSLDEVARRVLALAVRARDRAHLDPDFVDAARREIAEVLRRNPVVRIPGHLVLVGRVLGLLSGVSRSLGSRVDLVRTLLPYAAPPPPGS